MSRRSVKRDTYDYAASIARNLAERQYSRGLSKQWDVFPYPDTIGVLTQIDNMLSGMKRATKREVEKARRDWIKREMRKGR